MRVRHVLALPGAALALLVAPMSGPTAAAPPLEGSGTYTSVLTGGTLPEPRGNTAVFEFSNATSSSGSFTGTGTATYRCMQVGTAFFHCRGKQVLTGTVADVGSGTVVNRVKLTCDLVLGECESFAVNESGTGALAGIRIISRSRNLLGEALGTYENRVVAPGG